MSDEWRAFDNWNESIDATIHVYARSRWERGDDNINNSFASHLSNFLSTASSHLIFNGGIFNEENLGEYLVSDSIPLVRLLFFTTREVDVRRALDRWRESKRLTEDDAPLYTVASPEPRDRTFTETITILPPAEGQKRTCLFIASRSLRSIIMVDFLRARNAKKKKRKRKTTIIRQREYGRKKRGSFSLREWA